MLFLFIEKNKMLILFREEHNVDFILGIKEKPFQMQCRPTFSLDVQNVNKSRLTQYVCMFVFYSGLLSTDTFYK